MFMSGNQAILLLYNSQQMVLNLYGSRILFELVIMPIPQLAGRTKRRKKTVSPFMGTSNSPSYCVEFNHMATLIYKGDREVYFEQSCVQLKVGDPKKKSGNTGDHC